MAGGTARKRIIGLLAVVMLASAAALAAHGAELLNGLERSSVDVRFSLRGRQHPPSNVVIVGIDNDSLGVLPRYPFSRTLHAHVLDNLHAAGARLIVYDIAFDRPTTPENDLELYEAARTAAPVVFATSLISPTGATQVLGGNANLAQIGDQAAAADLLPDPDGVLRHTLAAVNGLPSIAAAVARQLTGRAPPQLHDGWIDYSGPPGTVRQLSFADVLHDHFNPAAVRGKVVVVGATAPVLQDLHSTAAGSPMSGPEVQANAIATALADFPLRSPANAVTTLLIVLLACMVPLAGVRLGTLACGLYGVTLIGLWSLAVQLAFNSGTILDYSDPLLALTLGAGGTIALGMWSDAREHDRLRHLFAAADAGVVDRVLHGDDRRLASTSIIAGYRLEGVVGRGGMGVVYRATQLALNRQVAVKLIAAESAHDPVFRERFTTEAHIASAIEHANVIPVYEAGDDDGLLFIAMRLVDGVDLAQLLRKGGALDPARAVRIISQIAWALDAAHARDLVHRDIKPANILLTLDEPEHAYLTDFGVSKQLGAATRVTRVGQLIGTLDYMAPEQIRGEDVGASADIYALTCVLYHCLTGQPPFSRDEGNASATLWAHMTAIAPSPSTFANLPHDLDAILARGMAKDPAERFSSATELTRACADALGFADAESSIPDDIVAELAAPDIAAPTIHSE